MKREALTNGRKTLSKNSIDTHKTGQKEDKAVNGNNEEQLESLVISTGIGLSKLKSLIKFVDTVIDDEINFNKNDFENLIIILRNMIDETSEQFEKIEKYLDI